MWQLGLESLVMVLHLLFAPRMPPTVAAKEGFLVSNGILAIRTNLLSGFDVPVNLRLCPLPGASFSQGILSGLPIFYGKRLLSVESSKPEAPPPFVTFSSSFLFAGVQMCTGIARERKSSLLGKKKYCGSFPVGFVPSTLRVNRCIQIQIINLQNIPTSLIGKKG